MRDRWAAASATASAGSLEPARTFSCLQMSESRAAQGLVEFALIIPLFLVLIVAMTDFTMLIATQTSMSTGTRNASRYGATSGKNSGGIARYNDCVGIRQLVEHTTLFVTPTVEIKYDPDGPGNAAAVEYCQGGIAADDIQVSMGGRVTVHSAAGYTPIAQYFLRTIPDLALESESSHSFLMDVYIK